MNFALFNKRITNHVNKTIFLFLFDVVSLFLNTTKPTVQSIFLLEHSPHGEGDTKKDKSAAETPSWEELWQMRVVSARDFSGKIDRLPLPLFNFKQVSGATAAMRGGM